MSKKEKVLIIGAGKSGAACASLLVLKGFDVFISDRKTRKQLAEKIPDKAVLIGEDEASEKASSFSFAVKSPGLENSHPLVKVLKSAGVPLRSEVETALSFSKTSGLIMITGTNGKTTTSSLCCEIMKIWLRKRGARAIACGNIGYPVSAAVKEAGKNDFLIAEVSSYQLADSSKVKPLACAILNITPDHIEHHGSMKAYVDAKARVFDSQDKNDYCVLNYEDKILRKISARCHGKKLYFSSRGALRGDGAFYRNGKIEISINGKSYRISPPALEGLHNIENAMAAALCAMSCGADISSVKKAFSSFKGVEHRIEFIREINGVKYYNDSKATNVDSTLIALKALGHSKNIWLILGGRDKKAPYKPLFTLVKKYVKAILTVGEAAPLIEKNFRRISTLIPAGDIFTAADIIKQKASVGDIALLSPACASYDQFLNFEERGKKFKDYVLSFKS
ncbi:MAG: UDP-N-acetylmuramoyl-L-alanine--D-glutamate ligase [Elusimicrobiota bacterium]